MTSIESLNRRLQELNDDISAIVCAIDGGISPLEHLEMRARLGLLQSQVDDVCNEISGNLGLSSAKDRILRYLQAHVGEVVSQGAIAGVAGISAYARRIRELRRDEGWLISSAESHPELRPGDYILLSLERDLSTTSQWDVARAIRLSQQAPAEKVIALLKALGGRADIEVARLALGSDDLEGAVRSARQNGASIEISPDAVEVSR